MSAASVHIGGLVIFVSNFFDVSVTYLLDPTAKGHLWRLPWLMSFDSSLLPLNLLSMMNMSNVKVQISVLFCDAPDKSYTHSEFISIAIETKRLLITYICQNNIFLWSHSWWLYFEFHQMWSCSYCQPYSLQY